MNYQFKLIGYPVKHSLSPWIHEQFLKDTDLTGTYELNEIQDLSEDILTLKEANLNGFNITVPYKEDMMNYLDEVDPIAKQIGAVNTVLVKDNKWIGYNTDGIGFVRALQDAYEDMVSLEDKKIVILGAGGAAKGIYAAFTKENPKQIVIANRTIEKAQDIIHSNRRNDIASHLNDVISHLEEADIIVQTSSVGMTPNEGESIVQLPQLKEDVLVSDIVYQPIETHFLSQAKKQGVRIHYGHTMLLYQAQYAFEIWTGKRPNAKPLIEKLEKILKG
ncbi:MAG TPA: shikimate dehydrogenase [Pseudogracilibacillus sp.]|nr:shikimate dehydrogenase [Pseudogracilibacillus sp.]